MRVAVFVDAGFLYARCSVILAGSALRRTSVELNQSAAISKLIAVANEKAAGSSLLRIYWYDGVLPSGPSDDQRALAYMDDVKLRLGVVTPFGQQKGVDSLIVTDLVELARNHAISDAILLSGDEDVRIGVQIAQGFGVRVHLIGIGAATESQSRSLLQEADTRTEWSRDDVTDILTLKAGYESGYATEASDEATSVDRGTESILDEVVDAFVASLSSDQVREIAGLDTVQPVPNEYDRQLLSMSLNAVNRYLSEPEKYHVRRRLKQAARDADSTS